MDIFGLLALLGGLALFLYGMNVMGDGLAKTSGGKLESLLERLTRGPIKGALLGAVVTAVIQSSSATTVMVVGFVNSGIMKLTQAVGIIMGANVGTTITSWILSLSGIESGNLFTQMLKPSSFAPIFALVGAVILLFAKSEKKKDIAKILLGFAVLMFGMTMMSDAVAPLADVPAFTNLLLMFSNPILGLIAGMVLTAVIQSSSASVGILQALCVTGSVSYSAAIPIIMGQNIGTCVTAMISGIGASKNAKRAAIIHLYFNLVGTALFMGVFYLLNSFIQFHFMSDAANAAGIAVVHSVFNIAVTLVLLPFNKGLVKLACLTIRDDAEDTAREDADDKLKLLEARFLEKPAFAVAQCRTVTGHMAELAREQYKKAISLFENYDEKVAQEVSELEDLIDKYEDELGTYMLKINGKEISKEDSEHVSILLHSIGDFERISDHAQNLMESAEEIRNKNLQFSDAAVEELHIFTNALNEIVDMAFHAFEVEDVEEARHVEPLEEVIDLLNVEVRERHIRRLRNEECTIELGFVLTDIITNYERIADHCSNIAVGLIQIKEGDFETHEYLDNLKQGDNAEFKELYKGYKKRYRLPA